jgi:hypothetical protein
MYVLYILVQCEHDLLYGEAINRFDKHTTVYTVALSSTFSCLSLMGSKHKIIFFKLTGLQMTKGHTRGKNM